MASCNPVKLAFSSFEPEEGEKYNSPIIFVHGYTACKESWEDLPQRIANATRRKTYAIDTRNHGDSEWSDVFNFDCNADDLLHFMDSIKAPKAILVGHSMGGIAAIKTALRFPERVEKLVAEDVGVKKIPKEMADFMFLYVSLCTKALEEVPSGLSEDEAFQFMRDYTLEHLPQKTKELVKENPNPQHNLFLLKPTEDGRYAFKANMKVLMQAMKNHETLMTEPTGVYDGPACFIYATISPFPVIKDEEQIKTYFPTAEFSGIAATHTIHADCPQEFYDTLLKFLLK